jgi:hypothetical protein
MDCPADAVTFQDGKFLVSVFAIRVADAGADVNARLIREAMETRFERRDSRGEIREARGRTGASGVLRDPGLKGETWGTRRFGW